MQIYFLHFFIAKINSLCYLISQLTVDDKFLAGNGETRWHKNKPDIFIAEFFEISSFAFML